MAVYSRKCQMLALISNACLHGLIEGVTRFIARDARCNSVMQAS